MTRRASLARRWSLAGAATLSATLLLCTAGASWSSSSWSSSSSSSSLSPEASVAVPMRVNAVDVVGITVSQMDRALAFYTGVLPFSKVSDQEVAGRPYELLTGVFGARSRVVRLRLGLEEVELTEFLTPKGRPMPGEIRANDRLFQHIAIVVSDIAKAYAVLRTHQVEHASTGPQRLPDWNPNAGGISAFYFRDPDRHFLEIIAFPAGKGLERWQGATKGVFLGIDHTAIVVDDTNASLKFYCDTLGMRVAGESENYDVEQEHLNNVFGARLRITALRADRGPGIELLEYLAPRDGHPAPTDLSANDIAHWQTTLVTERLDPLLDLARAHRIALVSPGPVDVAPLSLGFRTSGLTRDPDGHGIRLVVR
jgi:catechol 2,3-dioxygenase-like lactoylglutathione lyase family enzyme